MNHDDLTQALDDLRDAGVTFEPVPSAAALVRTLRERGLHVEPADAGVRIWPQRLLGAEDRDAIAQRIDDLTALVHAERRPTVAPALRAKMAALLERARAKLGDDEAGRMLALFRHDAGRAINEVENALAMHAAQGRVAPEAFAIFKWLLCRPGRVARFGEVLNAHGSGHVLAGRDTDPEYSREVARVAELLDRLEVAKLIVRQGDGLVAVLPEGVAP